MYYHSATIGFTEIPRALSCLNIFTVGCPFKCKGCQNPDLQDFENKHRKKLEISELQTIIDNSKGYIQGICWLGGEPLFQFADCMKINNQLKALYPNFINVIFTGYILQDIKQNHPEEYEALTLSGFDYIIDGQWNGHPLGTPECNQKVYKLDFNHDISQNEFIEISYQDYRNKK